MRLVSTGESGSLLVAASAGEYVYYYASFETDVWSSLMDVSVSLKSWAAIYQLYRLYEYACNHEDDTESNSESGMEHHGLRYREKD